MSSSVRGFEERRARTVNVTFKHRWSRTELFLRDPPPPRLNHTDPTPRLCPIATVASALPAPDIDARDSERLRHRPASAPVSRQSSGCSDLDAVSRLRRCTPLRSSPPALASPAAERSRQPWPVSGRPCGFPGRGRVSEPKHAATAADRSNRTGSARCIRGARAGQGHTPVGIESNHAASDMPLVSSIRICTAHAHLTSNSNSCLIVFFLVPFSPFSSPVRCIPL